MNKFLILIAAFLCIYQFSNAQTEKGDQTLGANLGFQYSGGKDVINNPGNNSAYSTNNNTYHGFNIGPNYSHFIADKLDLGWSLLYSESANNNESSMQGLSKNASHSFSGQVYLRKYILYQNKIGFRSGPYAGYSNTTLTNSGAPGAAIYKNKNSDYFGGADLALVYYPSKNIGVSALLARLEYDHSNSSGSFADSSGDDHQKSNNVNFNFVSNGVSLSVFYVFGK